MKKSLIFVLIIGIFSSFLGAQSYVFRERTLSAFVGVDVIGATFDSSKMSSENSVFAEFGGQFRFSILKNLHAGISGGGLLFGNEKSSSSTTSSSSSTTTTVISGTDDTASSTVVTKSSSSSTINTSWFLTANAGYYIDLLGCFPLYAFGEVGYFDGFCGFGAGVSASAMNVVLCYAIDYMPARQRFADRFIIGYSLNF